MYVHYGLKRRFCRIRMDASAGACGTVIFDRWGIRRIKQDCNRILSYQSTSCGIKSSDCNAL